MDLFEGSPKHIDWSRYGGYECSTKGDKRFSALVTKLPDGRTVEEHYQCDVKGWDPGGKKWWLGKGKPSIKGYTKQELWLQYLLLWKEWARHNQDLLVELRQLAEQHNCQLSDRFATSPTNQAHALAHILNER